MNYENFPSGFSEGKRFFVSLNPCKISKIHVKFLGFPHVPVFNADFKIPVKSQPPPPGTTDQEQESQVNLSTVLPPPLPPLPPSDVTVFQSPMFSYDPSYWNQSALSYQQQYPIPAPPEIPSTDENFSRKRKVTIDYMGKDDPDFPDELKKMFNALHCVLCDVKVNSPISAKMHYTSKVNENKKGQIYLEGFS